MSTLITREKLAVLGFSMLLIAALFAISIPSSRAQEASTPTSEVGAPTDSVGADTFAVVTDSTGSPQVTDTTSTVTNPTTTEASVEQSGLAESPITIEAVSTTSTIEDTTVAPADTSTSDVTQPAAVVTAPVLTPTLSTDQADYAPGSIVTVFGHFFSALQNIVLHLFGTNEDGTQSPEVTQPVVADTNGDFTSTFTLENIFRPFYNLSATTPDGTTLAQTTFTDSVGVTVATGGTSISADKAANATSPAFTTLGDIVITEGSNGDFADTAGATKTLILTAPSGWSFNTAAGSVSADTSKNIVTSPSASAPTISVTSSTLTVTFKVSGTNKTDTLTISGIQVK